jgi:hypothetical protein
VTASELKRILLAFVNEPGELDVRQGRIVAQIQDELIDVRLVTDSESGDLAVEDNGTSYKPRAWILRRVARLDLLADRVLSYTSETPAFIVPSGLLRADLTSASADREIEVEDVAQCLGGLLASPTPATTSVLYLTSDAGEGKTTLITQLARRQAEECKSRRSNWLLVPIALGGKTFLRFDDVVIGTLSNRFRFNRYYFDGFLELVKLGAIVPAFDGFEEMFVEGHSGEAVSALGSLIESLDSSGSILVAARKAFFEITSFRTQARLFDAIGDKSASFARLKINRWKKPQFIQYVNRRKWPQADELFDAFSSRLGATHPMLSRAFLVKRLVDLAQDAGTIENLIAELGVTPQDYFFKFVETLVEREAKLKWLDKTGDAAQPLLTLPEHHELLAAIAREMWQSSSNALRLDVIDVVVDMFAEPKRRGPTFVRQIRERIRNHSLLSTDSGRGSLLEFDHDEFRRFYLGEAVGRALSDSSHADLLSILSIDRLSNDTCDQAVGHVIRMTDDRLKCVSVVLEVARSSSAVSFARENCGALLVRLLSGGINAKMRVRLDSIVFPLDSLSGRTLNNVEFSSCRFEPTSVSGSKFADVMFRSCEFERFDTEPEDSFAGVTFFDCRISSLRIEAGESARVMYGPNEIFSELAGLRAILTISDGPQAAVSVGQPDDRIDAVEKFLRIFLRTTHVNEDKIRAKFGKQGTPFVEDILPELVRAGIVEQIEYRGRGLPQGRYKLSVPMRAVQDSLSSSRGSFDEFLYTLKKAKSG